MLLIAGLNFAQEQISIESETAPEVQWIWGEVLSVDTQKNELLVKYLGYEAENEKEINVNIDDKTTYENIKSLLDIKPHDNVSIDYIISPDGKNIAKNISIETFEGAGNQQEEIIEEEPKMAPHQLKE